MKKVDITFIGLGIFCLGLVTPSVVFGQTVTDFAGLLDLFMGLIASVIPFIMGLAMAYFLYGVFRYVLSAGDEKARTEGTHIMWYGIIALFVMISVWGLVRILTDTFGWGLIVPSIRP